jgi:uncharacterized membrane protein
MSPILLKAPGRKRKRVKKELSGIHQILDHRPGLRKVLTTAAVAAVFALLNFFLRIHLPGITHVDIRPQIVLMLAVGYFYGPWYGFLAGLTGNFCSDILLGYGLSYLPSWTVGNGLIGALIGFYPYRKRIRLDRIGQMGWLVISLILVNVVSITYAAGTENILSKDLSATINFRYFFLPALLCDVLSSVILFPALLFFLGRLKRNYPIKLALANYYLIVALLVVFWMMFFPSYRELHTLLSSAGLDATRGNALVDAFNHWSLLLLILLVLSFFISSWMSKTMAAPLKRLEESVFSVLEGDPSSEERLARFAKREDEIGILSSTVSLLSEKLWETQKLFRAELEKNMQIKDSGDSGTNILLSVLTSLSGREVVGGREDRASSGRAGDLSNLEAISLIVSAAGLKELAATYSNAKIRKSLESLDLSITDPAVPMEQRQALALSIDVNLLFKGRLKVMDIHAPLSRESAFHLLERIHAFRRSSKNYVGYVTEPDIVSRIYDKWENASPIRNERLERIMNRAIGQQVITGYQIKNLSDLAQFDAGLKIAYSHSNIKHITQLIGLLISENVQAKLQLEPKRSSFLYRDEWEKTEYPNLEHCDAGVMVAHKDEFDMVLEFTTREFRDHFRQIIDAYAKREFKDRQKILFESWYQPLYRSDIPVEGYQRVADIILRDKTHIVQVYTKEEEAAAKVEWFKQELQDMEISTSAIWVNDAFFRYLHGGYD